MIGRDIATTVLVDNTPLSFAYQPGAPRATAPPHPPREAAASECMSYRRVARSANGIPISTWRHDDSDRELLALLPLLDELAAAGDDLRPFSRAAAASSKSWSGGVPTSCSHRCWRRPSSSPPPPPQTAAAPAPLSPRRRSPQVEADIAAARARSADGGGGDANAAAEAPLSPPAAPAPPPPFVPPVNLSPVHQAA